MARRNAFGFKTGRGGIKAYRAAGKMFGQTFHTGRAAPDVRATCCRCGELCFVLSRDQLTEGVTQVPCYGCIKQLAAEARKAQP